MLVLKPIKQNLIKKLEEVNKELANTVDLISWLENTGYVFLNVGETDGKVEEVVESWNNFQTPDILPDSTVKEVEENIDKVLSAVGKITFSSLNEDIDTMQESLSTVIAAYDEYAEKGAYSLDTLQALTQVDRKYLQFLVDEEGQINLNKEAIEKLVQARVTEMRIKIIQQSIELINGLADEEAALKYVAEAQWDLNEAEYEGVKAELALAAAEALRRGENKEDMQKAIDLIYRQTNALLQSIGAWDSYGISGSKALEDVANAAEKARDAAKKLLKDEGDAIKAALDKKKDALQDELDALEKVYEAEDKEFELQKRINAYQRAQANKSVRLYTHDKGWQWVADPTKVKEAQDAVEEYQRELERDEAKKAIEDQIEAIEEMKEKVDDALDHIESDWDDNAENLAKIAEFEGMTLDQLGGYVDSYAQRVIEDNAKIEESYKKAAGAAAAFNNVVQNDLVTVPDPAVGPSGSGGFSGSGGPLDPETPVKGKVVVNSTKFIEDIGNKLGAAVVKPALNSVGSAGKQAQEDGIITNLQEEVTTSLDKTVENIFKSFSNAAKAPKYHTGGLIKGITPGANVSEQFVAYMNRLQKNEVPAILEAGEYVLTKQHQADILSDRATLINSIRHGGNVTLEIGDIVINQPVGNVESLSSAIIQKLPNQIMRDLYSR